MRTRDNRNLKFLVCAGFTFLLITFIIPYNPPGNIDDTLDGGGDVNPHNRSSNDHVNNPSDSSHPGHTSHDEKGDKKTNLERDTISDDGGDKKQLFVILVTGFRTGSTFLGELFSQNDDGLYLFEPFHQGHVRALAKKGMIQGVGETNTILEQRTAYLDQIINRCDLGYPNAPHMSRSMQCDTAEENLRRWGDEKCDWKRWNNICKKTDFVALKLIRLQRISHLELVPGIEKADIRVIHMIRDPRATMNSRIPFGWFWLEDETRLKVQPLTPETMEIAARDWCTREADNLQYTNDLPSWLSGRYLRITHEELSLQPTLSAEKLYKFIGRQIPPNLNEFLLEHTTLDQPGGLLNTRKDSKAVIEKWKHSKWLELPIIRQIEESCKIMMDIMGYEQYDPNET